MLPSEHFRSRFAAGRTRDSAMTCVSARAQSSRHYDPQPSTSGSTTTGTVLPPSFHPQNSRTPLERQMADRLRLYPGVAQGVPDSPRYISSPGRPLADTNSINRGGHSESGSSSVPVAMVRGIPSNNTAPPMLPSLNPSLLTPPVGPLAWNGLGFFPLVPREHLAGGHLPGYGPWRVKQPVVNREYLELAMLVCNTFRGKLFPCPHCRYVTDRRNNLKRHIATMHETCEKALECCGVTFQTKASLREHIMIFHHNGYSCPYCGRRFCRKALLKRHLSVHSGRKDYSCQQCDYATSHKSNLERHKKIHERCSKSPHSDDKLRDDSLFFRDNKCHNPLRRTTTATSSSPGQPHETSPVTPDSTVTCSAIDGTTHSEVMKLQGDVTSFSDDSLSDDDVDVECG